MTTPPLSGTPATLTEEQTLSILLEATGDLDTAQALQKNLPSALLKTGADTLAALDKAARDLQAIQWKVETHLDRLQPLNSFCIDVLNRALSARWHAVFNVEKDHLQLPGNYCGCEPVVPPGGGPAIIPFATPTLLEAAMQNFTEDEAQPDYFPEGSVIRISSAPAGVPGLTPTSFAAFCRELNLGQRYQQHFLQVFGVKEVDGNLAATGPVVLDITAMKKQLLQLDLHLAMLREHVSREGVQTIQRLIDAGGVATARSLQFKGRALIMQGIELLGSCIWGVVVFSESSVELNPDQWCLVYMPGEPDQPLYEYARFTAFMAYLEFRLRVGSYRSYFTHCIGEGDRLDFFKTFADTGSLGHVRQLEMPGPLFEFMLKSHVGKLQLDARVLAVPTEDVDEEARRTRLLHYLDAGMTVANVAGFVVPVLGELMMGVAIGQMLAQVYEGVDDWSRGDRQEAFSHLLSVAENLVLMAVVGAGIKGLKSLAIRTVRKHPDFFQPFTAILDGKGQSRLWKPDLQAYEQSLPVGAAPDSEVMDLYRGDDRFFARVDQRFYEVVHDPASDTWSIRHPVRPDAYAPPLKPHRHGGWRHAWEESEQWSGAYTLRRIDPSLGRFEDSRLEMIRRLTDTRFEELHRLSDDNLSWPPRLRDMIERFGIERRLRDFVSAMERGEATDARHVQEQLHALPELANWPTDRYIKVVDEKGRLTATYPPVSIDDDTLSIVVSHEQLEKGELLQTVLEGIYPREAEALVGANIAPADASVKLAQVIGAAVKADRRSVFDHLYRQFDRGLAGESVKLHSAFPGLPVRYARELLRRTPTVERMHLRSTGRVPMGLAQRARQALSDVRVDRALAGFYLADIASADTRKLALRLLPRLAGWNTEFYLELRANTLNGEVLETSGEKPLLTSNSCTLVRLDNGYEVFGSDRKSLGKVVPGPEDVYHAILKGLPMRQRKAIGFAQPKPEDGWRLRHKLLASALDEREGCARVLAGGRMPPAISEPACTLANSPVGPARHSQRLLRKVKKLYPLMTDVQADEFLDQAGSDPMTRAIRVRQLQEDLRRLQEVLDIWSEDETAMKALGGDLNEVHECRQVVAFEIEDCFRRLVFLPDDFQRPVYGLKLDGMQFGKFPTLPTGLNFDHVRQLSLRDMQLDNDAAYFLKAFRQVESLELDRNQLTLLPEVISHMPNLKRLSLANNRIQLTEHSLVKLAKLYSLQSLNLSGNPLGATVDVSRLFELTHLSLRNTRTTELPEGLQFLPNLDWVDLRDNEIRDLPAWLFETPRRFSETINLRHNPISAASRIHLDDYRKTFGVGMGYLDNDLARLDENQARSIWLTETGGEEGSRHLQTWNAIKDDTRAEGLFSLLAELGNSAESASVREDMTRRVWTVLDATQADTELREQIFDLAANPINCTDNAALNFSHLEVAVQVHHVTRASRGQRSSAAALVKLARGLFRLEQIDRIAAEHTQAHGAADPLEVTLAYRSGLAQALELPGQPSHMRYASLAQVTGADLVAAINRIQTAELSSEWLAFLVRQHFWSEYVKSSFTRQFDDARAPHQQEALALFEKAETLSSADYLSEMHLCAARQERTESALLEQLTDQVLRLLEGNLCVLPAG